MSEDQPPADGLEPPDQPPSDAASDDLDGYLTPTRRLVRAALPVIGVVVAIALVLPLGQGLIDAWLFDRAGGRVVEEVTDEIDAALAESVVLVRTTTCAGQAGSGTGFVASIDGRPVLLTNRHVVDGARSVGVRPLSGGSLLRVSGWRLSATADVAVLLVDDPERLPSALPVLERLVEADTEVRTVGFPRAFPFTSAGSVVQVARDRLLVDVRTDRGASGSPLLDGRGTAVGQIRARTADGLGVATPGPALLAALRDLGPTVTGC